MGWCAPFRHGRPLITWPKENKRNDFSGLRPSGLVPPAREEKKRKKVLNCINLVIGDRKAAASHAGLCEGSPSQGSIHLDMAVWNFWFSSKRTIPQYSQNADMSDTAQLCIGSWCTGVQYKMIYSRVDRYDQQAGDKTNNWSFKNDQFRRWLTEDWLNR